MNLYCFHLKPHKGFHFGMRGVGIEASTEFAPSDTVFSALCSALRVLAGKSVLEDMLQAFYEGNPHFLVSTGFPFTMLKGQPLRFFPAPLTLQQLPKNNRLQKDLHKARWLSESVFKAALRTAAPEGILIEEIEAFVSPEEARALKKEYHFTDGKLRLWAIDDVPRVAVDRITNASNVYRSGFVTFVNGGIWLGFVYQNKAWCQQYLPLLLHFLSDQGLGGERSSGYGLYQVLEDLNYVDATFSDVLPNRYFITLSYYYPNLNRENVNTLTGETAYALDVRRGWMSSPEGGNLRRKSVRMITTGSVLKAVNPNIIYGALADVTPDIFKDNHRVYRYGFALPIAFED
jgi:CRISPR-associated protein Csm4